MFTHKKSVDEVHFAIRLHERYGLQYSKQLADKIEYAMGHNNYKLVHRYSTRKAVSDITINVDKQDISNPKKRQPGECIIRIVYKKEPKIFITALPLGRFFVEQS
jgi:hypothetical protein